MVGKALHLYLYFPERQLTSSDHNLRRRPTCSCHRQNYGQASTIDANNQYYAKYMSPYKGTLGTGSANGNHFWPIPGNHGKSWV